ncbi:hypothetical protein LMG3458_05068 [Achromobacter deleyi]|uniref:HTH tetR-type domain-containing protein n=1 Tax=Achromobacter deleyi TaxID=1353891 RepID=A0A6S7ALE1_9BURK|nr:TetR/AcrR family transcriptional regulator [Achromobacter deleyi]CAB3733577.1 hypothetical protein LMG3458_05068 [Achromobacter deleyi]CAB3908771.1 hypothetical protein LMG3481_04659 [Achromobacter deleyi]CAB3909417.1 hypothetical protein LMG3482_04735 [Achromobacter deleyi]
MATLASPSALRPRGRPARPDAELHAAALQAATWLLLNEGYAAATLEAVAKRAGMAKKTVYRFAANREDLVAQVVRGWTDTFEPVMAQEVASAADVLPALSRVLQAIADRALSSDAVGMFRLLTSDFPARQALLDVYQKNGIERGTAMLAAWFEKLAARGLIRIKQPIETAGLLLAMVIAEPLRQMALGLTPPLPEGSVQARIEAGVALFSGQGGVFEVRKG